MLLLRVPTRRERKWSVQAQGSQGSGCGILGSFLLDLTHRHTSDTVPWKCKDGVAMVVGAGRSSIGCSRVRGGVPSMNWA
jgi:hypothetical protein